jgi:polysaccharide chain length determinant protein (PEP-CTERM system associated)
MLFLFVGWNWPKIYSSSSTILVDQKNILQPLMAGTTVTTDVLDRARLAREVVFSRKAMTEVMESNGFLDGNPTDKQKEWIIAELEKSTWIQTVGSNIIRIGFDSRDPTLAFQVAEQMGEIFIRDSLQAKRAESKGAFDFIDGQVQEYHTKLKVAEEALKQFHSANIDARPGTQAEVNARIVELRRRMEATQLELRELRIKRETLKKQLSGEAVITQNLTREGQLRTRLADLEEQRATLRLSYLDTYPDIVRLNSQIESIQESIFNEQRRSTAENNRDESGFNSVATNNNLLYQELRGQFSATETLIASLTARLDETNELLEKEEERIVRINEVEAHLSELTRDYNVNQNIYQDLLRDRESARISMNIDLANQGLTFKIQEPAVLQLTPQGIRFAHFLLAGLVCSFAFPIGLIYGLTLLDRRVRFSGTITEKLGLPVLASVYHMNTPIEYSLNTFKKSIILLAILLSWSVYVYAGFMRLNGEL